MKGTGPVAVVIVGADAGAHANGDALAGDETDVPAQESLLYTGTRVACCCVLTPPNGMQTLHAN